MISTLILIAHLYFWEFVCGIYVGGGSVYWPETLMLAAGLFIAEIIGVSLGIQKLFNWAMVD